jgi:hypothetical protein
MGGKNKVFWDLGAGVANCVTVTFIKAFVASFFTKHKKNVITCLKIN